MSGPAFSGPGEGIGNVIPIHVTAAALGIDLPANIPDLGRVNEMELFRRFSEPFMEAIPEGEHEEPLVRYARRVGSTGLELTLRNDSTATKGLTKQSQALKLTGRVASRLPHSEALASVTFEASAYHTSGITNLPVPSIAMVFATQANLDPSFELIGTSLEDIQRLYPSATSTNPFERRVYGRDMSPKLRARFGIGIPILEGLGAVKLEEEVTSGPTPTQTGV